jgi:hypothetical protein
MNSSKHSLKKVDALFSRCACHMAQNCQRDKNVRHESTVTNVEKENILAIAKCRTYGQHKEKLDELQASHAAAAQWVDSWHHQFVLYHFLQQGKRRFGKVTNNAAENMNSAFLNLRAQPVLDLTCNIIDWILNKKHERFQNSLNKT